MLGGYRLAHSSAFNGRDRQWTVGGYGEIGLLYMFTRHIGLGWRGMLLGSRTKGNASQGNGLLPGNAQQATAYHLDLQPVQVMGTIYF